jgi:hypothetical protein
MQFFTEHAEIFLYYPLNLAPKQLKLEVHMLINDHLCTIFWFQPRLYHLRKVLLILPHGPTYI